MKNENNVDKLGVQKRNSPVFQQKIKIYSQRTNFRVDNVEKISHIKKSRKYKDRNRIKKEIHTVYIKLFTSFPQNVDKYFF